LALSYWIDYLGFISEGKFAVVLITPSLGVPNWSVIYIFNTAPSAISQDGRSRKPGTSELPCYGGFAMQPAMGRALPGVSDDQEATRRQSPKEATERRAKAYTIIDGQLYKRSTSGIFMKCISQVDGIEILREIHEGECGHHAAARSLVAKAFRHGFY
jgi:hypothetical protein